MKKHTLFLLFISMTTAQATEFDGLWGCVDLNSVAPEPYVFLQREQTTRLNGQH